MHGLHEPSNLLPVSLVLPDEFQQKSVVEKGSVPRSHQDPERGVTDLLARVVTTENLHGFPGDPFIVNLAEGIVKEPGPP